MKKYLVNRHISIGGFYRTMGNSKENTNSYTNKKQNMNKNITIFHQLGNLHKTPRNQGSSIKKKDNDNSTADGWEKSMGTAIIPIAMRRQSFSLLNVFSTRCRRLYSALSKEHAVFPVLRGGMQTTIPLALRGSRSQPAPSPPSARNVLSPRRRY